MALQLLGSTCAFVLAALPIVVLTGLSLIGHMVGEWASGALLAYGAVLLGFLSGVAAGGARTGVWQLAGGVGAVTAFAALSIGGPAGLTILVVAFAVLSTLAEIRPLPGLPWVLFAIGAVSCLMVAVGVWA